MPVTSNFIKMHGEATRSRKGSCHLRFLYLQTEIPSDIILLITETLTELFSHLCRVICFNSFMIRVKLVTIHIYNNAFVNISVDYV